MRALPIPIHADIHKCGTSLSPLRVSPDFYPEDILFIP